MFNFKRLSKYIFLVIFFFNTPIIVHSAQSAPLKIAIITPIEHESLTQIIAGIQESLKDEAVDIIVKNGQGDTHILFSLIKQIKDEGFHIVLALGTSTSQMAISHLKDIPLICVAALIDPGENPFITGINDEVPATKSLAMLPHLRILSVIHSASEKVTPEIEILKKYAHEQGITLNFSMIQTLVDLPAAVKSAPDDIQAFFLLKDHLVVSGINVLVNEAFKRSIPLIASDEGSVIKGATLALGVKEKEIGLKAGAMARSLLKGAKPNSLPYQTMEAFTLFVNEKSFLQQKVLSQDDLKAINLPLIIISEKTER